MTKKRWQRQVFKATGIKVPEISPIDAIEFRMDQYQHTQADLSRATGILRSHISEILAGKRKLSIKTIRKLVFKYGIPAESLIKEY